MTDTPKPLSEVVQNMITACVKDGTYSDPWKTGERIVAALSAHESEQVKALQERLESLSELNEHDKIGSGEPESWHYGYEAALSAVRRALKEQGEAEQRARHSQSLKDVGADGTI